jgi:poly-gamma-glutamate synthesis protein (capsule biosynthesis protein)
MFFQVGGYITKAGVDLSEREGKFHKDISKSWTRELNHTKSYETRMVAFQERLLLNTLVMGIIARMSRYAPIFVILILLLAACQSAAAQPAVTATFTPFQPDFSATPVPTQTPTILTVLPAVPGTPTPAQTAASTFPLTPIPTETAIPRTTLLFTGVIVPARCVQAAIDANDGNADYIFDNVRDLIQSADVAVGTFNATMSDYPPHTGCVFTYVLVGGSSNADALQRAGFDVMSVATNHIKNCGIGDCGDRAFLDTLDNLNRVGIVPVGAGNDLAEAMQPVVVTANGVRFGIVSLGMVEPMVFAGEDTPGIAVLTEENLRQAIADARQVSDVVIAMPHWGPEDSVDPNSYQLDFARIAVDAGADLVVGNHTHVVQATQEIDGVPVFYGLGNFVFDQTWDLEHQQGVILRVTYEGTKLVGYELIPTHVDGDGTVHIADAAEAADVLQRIQDASERIK